MPIPKVRGLELRRALQLGFCLGLGKDYYPYFSGGRVSGWLEELELRLALQLGFGLGLGKKLIQVPDRGPGGSPKPGAPLLTRVEKSVQGFRK